MRTGDVLEVLGAACLAVAAYGYMGWRLAVIVAGVALVYEGQCLAHAPFPWPNVRRPHIRRRKVEK